MNIIDQLGAQRFTDDAYTLRDCKRIGIDDRFVYGFDVLRALNTVERSLERVGIEANTAFIDEEGDFLTAKDISMSNLQDLVESEYPLVMNVRQKFLDFVVGIKTDFPVIYFDTAHPMGLQDLTVYMQQDLHQTLLSYIPTEEDDYEGEEREPPFDLAHLLFDHEDFEKTIFNSKYLVFPTYKEAIQYLRSPLFRYEIEARSDWKYQRISDMEDNLGRISQFLKSTDLFDDFAEECLEEASAKLGCELDCDEVYDSYVIYETQVVKVLETLYELDSNFSLYLPYEFDSFIVSEKLSESIKEDIEDYAKEQVQSRKS